MTDTSFIIARVLFHPLSSSRQYLEGVIISWHYIFTADDIWWRGRLYRDIIFSLLTIFGEGVIISWHIFTPDNIWWGGDDIVTQYNFLLTIFGEGVIISWHYIFTPHNIWRGGYYIVTLYFHSWQYLVRGWLYRHHISLSKFDSTMIPGFYYYSYIYIHPIGELKWLYLSMIPSLLLKLSVSDGYVDRLYQQSMMNKDL